MKSMQAKWGIMAVILKESHGICTHQMLLEHGLPPEIQVWVIRNRIPCNTDTLEQCGLVPAEQSSIYLYLAARQAAGLTDEVYQQKYGVLFGGKGQGQNFSQVATLLPFP